MKAVYIIPIFLILLFLYLYLQVSWLRIRKVHIKSSKLSRDYKILHLTDIHANPFIRYENIFSSIQNEKPDLICITGDIIKKDSKELESLKELFENLEKTNLPLFFIYGNHDLRHKSRKKIESFLKNYPVHILKDESFEFEKDILINGYDHKKHLAPLNKSEEKFTLSLVHDPILFVRSKEQSDLVLCGHTHGGQVRFPIVGAVYVPNQTFKPKYSKGLYETEKSSIYIDSGLGYSMLPLRFLNPIQMSYILIKKSGES